MQTQNSQYQLDPFAQTSFQVPQVVEKSFPTNHGDTFAPFGHQQHVNQNVSIFLKFEKKLLRKILQYITSYQ